VTRTSALWVALATLSLGCGGANASLGLGYNAPKAGWTEVVVRVADAGSEPTSSTLLLRVTDDTPPQLVAHESSGAERWRSETVVGAVVVTAGESVVTVEGDVVVVRDRNNGSRRFTRDLAGMSLLGAAREGDTLALVSAAPSVSATNAVSTLAVLDARSGDVRWQRTVVAALGAPVLRGGVLIVPWNHQGLSALNAATGEELSRRSYEGESIDWISAGSGALVFGSNSVVDFACSASPDTCAPLPSPFVNAPSRPEPHASGYRAAAQRGIRTLFHTSRDELGRLRYSNDRAYLVFYRYVLAFDATGALSWIRVLADDVVDAKATAEGVTVLDRVGVVTRFGAREGTTDDTAQSSESLQGALLRVVVDTDNRLVVARAYAVDQLALDPDPKVTQYLLDAYEYRSTPAGLKSVLAAALVRRRVGSEHLIASLSRHHDFLTGIFPPPMAAVVPALVAMEARDAAAALVSHLKDPATSTDDVALIADALASLGDQNVAIDLARWLHRYRASSAFASEPQVVTAIARAAAAFGTPEVRAGLLATAELANTEPIVAAAILHTLAPVDEEAPTEAAAVAKAPALTPRILDQAAINAAFAGHSEALRACIRAEQELNPLLGQVRIAFVVQPDGGTHGFAFAPNGTTFTSCMRAITLELRLPAFDGAAKVARYVVQLRHARVDTPATEVAQQETTAEWWTRYARNPTPVEGAPWWSAYVEREHAWLPTAISNGATTDAPAAAFINDEHLGAAMTPAQDQPPSQRPSQSPTPSAMPPALSPEPTPTPPTQDAPPDNWWLPSQP